MKRCFILFCITIAIVFVFGASRATDPNSELADVEASFHQAQPTLAVQPFIDHPNGGEAISDIKAIPPQTDDFSPYVPGMVALVSQEHYTEYLQTLENFVTRNSNTPSCDQAAAWILSQFQSFGLDAYFHPFSLGGQTKYNVIGELAGSVYPDSVLFITAHYDATIGQPSVPEPVAPGADDNASGTACVIECARILSMYQFERTIRFVAFAGEEQGLVGSFSYVQNLQQANTAVVGSFNYDMIAYSGAGSPPFGLSIITNNNPFSQAMAAKIDEATETFTPQYLIGNVYVAPGSASSDHYPFWAAGWPASFSIHAASYPYYHTAFDLLINCNMEYGANVTKVAIAALADFAVPLGGGTELSGAVAGIWTLAGSPYTVVDSIWVPRDSSLTIEPGVLVIFSDHYTFKVLPGATLRALGTEDDPIQFMALDAQTGWGGIRFLNASDSSRLQFCKLRHGISPSPAEEGWGGAIHCNGSSPTLDHCLITNNGAVQGGAIACLNSSNPLIIHCTFADNSAAGSILYCGDSSPTLQNCILWDYAFPVIEAAGTSDPQITYSDIRDGWSGVGNMNLDPIFVNANLGNYHLQSIVGSYAYGAWMPDSSYSPCIDAGDPAASYANEPEPNGDRLDMGCYGNTDQASLSLNDPHYAFGNVDGVWTAAENNPMNVIGDIFIPSGETLTIEPGVQILFQGHYSLEVQESATLLAVGTIEDSIAFIAANPEEGWQGIRFLTGASDSSWLQYGHLSLGIATGFSTDGWGGAVFCDSGTSPTIQNCLIDSCTASSGGAIYCREANPAIIRCTLSGNTAASGGAIYADHGDPLLEGNILSGNSASNGGALTLWFSAGQINNNVISGNSAIGSGGGIYCINSSPSLVNNMVVANTSNAGGGGFALGNLGPVLINCILWGNSPTQLTFGGGTSPQVSYCNVQGGWSGEGNLDADPLFLGGLLSEYQLSPNSPCVDAGSPAEQYDDPEDPANPGSALWPALGTVRNDMGAFGGQGASGWVGVKPDEPSGSSLPDAFSLEQNYPNPFNPTTAISFQLSAFSHLSLRIYDTAGRLVQTLVDGWREAGEHEVRFDGSGLASGIYIARLQAGSFRATRKMVLLK